MLPKRLRSRFWLENALAAAALILAIATVVQPEWVEVVFGIDPDASSGAFEWALTSIAAASALVAGWLARREWRRTKVAVET